MEVDNQNPGDNADVENIFSKEKETLNISEETSESGSSKIVDISHDTTRDTENGDTFDCLETVSIDLNLIQDSGVLLEVKRKLEDEIPSQVSRLESLLTELQEENDNSRSHIQETYQSYRAILEQCMNYALADLDSRHHRKELAIMERLEQVESLRSQLQLTLSSKTDGQETRLEESVTRRLEQVMMRLERESAVSSSELNISLEWETDTEMFTRAVRDNFGQFSDDKHKSRKITSDHGPSPRLLVSDHGNKDLVSALLSPEPALSHHNLAPGLLTLGPMSPLSPVTPALSSPQNRSGSAHGPIGSALSSPAHGQYRSHLGLSQPDLTVTSPQNKQSHNSNNLPEYNCLSNLDLLHQVDRPGSGTLTSSRSGFTLAELISNVTETDESRGPWSGQDNDSGGSRSSTTALSNLAALAKLDTGHNTWSAPDSHLLLPDTSVLTSHDAISPAPQHSLSPVLGLGPRGASPLSPIDSLMPAAMGGLSLSPTNLLRSPSSSGSIGGGRALNSMQIRCKFGQLGPGKGQFNSPHGFCLGVDEEIIVADTNNHRIQVFEKNGTFRYQFGVAGKEEGQLWYPRKVAVMKSSGKYVVCDRGNERSRMQIFTRHGHFVRKIAIRYIDIVAGLAITRDGHIVAVDSVTPTIFVILDHGELLRWFDCSDYMREPSDIAVSGREFFVCDFKGHNVVVFTEEGQYVRRIGCENITNFPNGIDISDAGDILIGDSHGNKFHVVVFANDGTLLGEFECPHVKVSRCCGLKITSEGYVVTLAKNNHHVLVLNTLYIN